MNKVKYISVLILIFGLALNAFSQENAVLPPDSILLQNELTIIDETPDSLKAKRQIIDSPINYDSRDSMAITMEDGQQIVHLYGGANIKYGTIELNADYIAVDFDKKEIFATGLTDTLGEVTGKPHFVEGSEEFDCSSLRYNFETGKGFIENVVTKQDDGLIRGSKAKMMSKDIYCMVDGKYSTCDAEHPHFYLNMTKGKVLREKAIITGRAYMVLEDFPIYFPFLPYGFIPQFDKNKNTGVSGILFPDYGQEERYGFFLKNGGFYWAASDYFDLKLTGDIYTSGKWALNAETKYRLRYKFSGNFRVGYSLSVTGIRELGEQVKTPNFSVVWNHSQDSKANPSSTFTANVNFSTSGYDKEENYEDVNKVLNSTKSSNITYRKTFQNTPFSLTLNVGAQQNTKTQTVNATLPSMTVNMKSIQPFKKVNNKLAKSLVKDVKFAYTANIDNRISTTEDLLFSTPFSDWKKSIKHSLPITLQTFTLLNHINVVPSISYNEQWYFDYTEKYWLDGYYVTDPEFGTQKWVSGHVEEEKKDGFKRNYEYSGSLSASTTVYGTYSMKNPNSKIVAIRHKMDPSISLSYHPDFKDVKRFGFYEMVQVDSLGSMETYNIFGSSASGKSGSIGFGVNNNVEMKLLNDRDTTSNDKYKKVAIFDNLSFRSSYNLAAKENENALSPFSINARTKIAGTSININATLDPYALDERNQKSNVYMWNTAKGISKLGRITNISTGYGFNYSSDKLQKRIEQKQKGAGGNNDEVEKIENPSYMPFNMPWRINANYTFGYVNTNGKPKLNQSVSLSGGIDFTEKWTSTFSSGFDIASMKITHAQMSIVRNLHCWTMSFNFSPIGVVKYYTFSLVANSSMLSDVMKLERRSGR